MPNQDSEREEIKSKLGALVEARIGHVLPAHRLVSLAGQVPLLAKDAGRAKLSDYLSLLKTLPLDARAMQSFIRAATNKESCFFSDAPTMESLRKQLLPQVISRCSLDKRLRVWSAGCSSGEELYTLSILLRELIFDYDSWKVTLLGTDIDADALEKARQGSYKDRSLRTTSETDRHRFFTRDSKDGSYLLRAFLKQNVQFSLHNLADGSLSPPAPGKFDLILCRNVLVCFPEQRQLAAFELFRKSLSAGGFWVTAPADPLPKSPFTTTVLPGLLAHTVQG